MLSPWGCYKQWAEIDTQIAKTFGSTSFRHRSDTSASDRCPIDDDVRAFAIWAGVGYEGDANGMELQPNVPSTDITFKSVNICIIFTYRSWLQWNACFVFEDLVCYTSKFPSTNIYGILWQTFAIQRYHFSSNVAQHKSCWRPGLLSRLIISKHANAYALWARHCFTRGKTSATGITLMWNIVKQYFMYHQTTCRIKAEWYIYTSVNKTTFALHNS